MKGLPDDAAVRAPDKPGWTKQDEWAAQTLESITHWLSLLVLAQIGGKGPKLPMPERIYTHPDRPKAAEKRGGARPMTVSEFEASQKKKQKEKQGRR